jgi:hypothetical protein
MKSKKNIKKIKQKRKTRKNKNKKRSLRFKNRKPLRGGSDEEEICSICMESITENDWFNNPKITTPCQHIFHATCLHLWCKRIENQLETCPICRRPIRDTCRLANVKRGLDSNEENFLDYLDERRYLDTPPPEDETESDAENREFWRRDNLTTRIRESRTNWDSDLEYARGMFESEQSMLLDSD